MVHNMQLRVAGLIERCQDEIVLESTLIINDDLNTLFVRYDRWLRNSAAAKAGGTEGAGGQDQQQQQPLSYEGQPQVVTTSLMGVRVCATPLDSPAIIAFYGHELIFISAFLCPLYLDAPYLRNPLCYFWSLVVYLS